MAASVTHSLATVSDTWETELAPPGIPDDFAWILQNSQGANLDVDTIDLLTASGVYDAKSFILFTQEPFSDLLSTLSDSQFSNISGDKLCNAQLYGRYLVEQRLVQTDGTVDTTSFDWREYYTYWHRHRHQVGISFNAAYQLEAEARRPTQMAQPIRHGPPSADTAPITHDTGVDTTVTPTPVPHAPLPSPSLSDAKASIYTPHASVLDFSDTGEATAHSDDSFSDALDTAASTDCSTDLFFDAEDWDYDSYNTDLPSDPDCPSPTPNTSSCPVQQYPYSQMTLNLSRLHQPRQPRL